MELTVFWTEFAKEILDDIFEHHKLKSKSVKVARKLVGSIVDRTITPENQLHIGQKEELLSDRPQKFRYLVFKNYKIIYWINEPKKTE
ncbi:type II toxin-antitoxin system RelE/ParE family toxin [uncultured Kriegella sp.]|uniref:type II toxin-antitoxin system RelE/ParE family toxin n=1 Tax=uncultured Kriegella sp. TaxID=1798910 RepID=UPI0030DD9609|tara:strand:- start:95653 stop:95916 length:264 start_codon:yes stop_codon:yes gene_type:complete